MKYNNVFFVLGIVMLVIMVMQLDFDEVWQGITHAGYWFGAVVGLWALLYVMNTAAWCSILRSDNSPESRRIGFWRLYGLTVSGFALNYATPGGLMGGEPFRIMSIAPVVGTERASSSVILYAMTHIFSHFWFWLISAVLFLVLKPFTIATTIVMVLMMAFSLTAIWFFLKGYKRGIAVQALGILRHIPFIKKWARGFVERNRESLDDIDRRIAALHGQNRRTFVTAVMLELGCRIISSLEILFVLQIVEPGFSFLDSMLTLAFTSLFANMLFFIPLQLGGREGGFLLSASALGVTVSSGVFVALIVRLREIIWTGLGLLLIKVFPTQGGELNS